MLCVEGLFGQRNNTTTCVTSIHSRDRYVSRDLDLVNVHSAKRRAIREAMEEIGFTEEGRCFTHPASALFIEFPPGPLTVGAEPVRHVDETAFATGTLRIISPTDCVKDRLAAYYHWGDRQCLIQASLVAREHEIDLEEVRRWSDAGGKLDEFKEIREKLASKPG